MNELLVFDEESWDNMFNMLVSPDENSRKLAIGLLRNIDYTNKKQMSLFEDQMHLVVAHKNVSSEGKGEIIHTYFTALGKQNGNNF
jgi:hypothetical protein